MNILNSDGSLVSSQISMAQQTPPILMDMNYNSTKTDPDYYNRMQVLYMSITSAGSSLFVAAPTTSNQLCINKHSASSPNSFIKSVCVTAYEPTKTAQTGLVKIDAVDSDTLFLISQNTELNYAVFMKWSIPDGSAASV